MATQKLVCESCGTDVRASIVPEVGPEIKLRLQCDCPNGDEVRFLLDSDLPGAWSQHTIGDEFRD